MSGAREGKVSDGADQEPSEDSFRSARLKMVETQLRRRGIMDTRLLAAMEEVPRDRFVPEAHRHEAYADCPLPIGLDQTISQPYVVALMLQELGLQPHHRVLDIGAGSGYQTAILARLVRHVFGIERIDQLTQRARETLAGLDIRNVTLTTGDGTLGWPDHAPFDRIISGAGSPDIPPPWMDQLADDGRIIAPVGQADVQTLLLVTNKGGDFQRRYLSGVRFVRLIGQFGW